ncbi:MAG: ribose-phosphate pyrophosphokinase [Deltaproteobacteria bacterium]|nr:ribose-phosphate pyrophosphokinase [Deltaproteobacteria bacterium]
MEDRDVVLMPGKQNDPFARDLSNYLGINLCPVQFTEFRTDAGPMAGETKVEVKENIRGRTVYILWSIEYTNYELMNVLQLIDAAILSSGAKRISLVCPEFPCARQDKSHERRESLTSRLVARLLESVGLDEMLTADLHSDQIEGHFRISLDHLRTRPIWGHYIARRYKRWEKELGLAPLGQDLVLGVPDAGRARAVRELSDEVGKQLRQSEEKVKIQLAHHDKHRSWEKAGQVESHGLLGDVENKVVWFTDDLLASGSTLFEAAKGAKLAGARHVVCSVTHAHGFDRINPDGSAGKTFAELLEDSDIDELVVTDTHPRFIERVRTDSRLASKTTVLSLTPLFGEAIQRIRRGQTLKEMMTRIKDHAVLYWVVQEAGDKPMP